MLDSNSIFSNLVLLAVAHNRFNRPLEAIKWRSRINLWLNTCFWRVFAAAVTSIAREEKRIVQRILPVAS